jgi:hypothetical protein
LQATYADHVVLRVSYPKYLALEETTGKSVSREEPVLLDTETNPEEPNARMQLSIPLSSIQYGQSRDIVLKSCVSSEMHKAIEAGESMSQSITAVLEYRHFNEPATTIRTVRSTCSFFDQPSTLPASDIAYHVSRSMLVSFLSELYLVQSAHSLIRSSASKTGEYVPFATLPPDILEQLQSLLVALPANKPENATDPRCQSLLLDIRGSDGPLSGTGQVELALASSDAWSRWGKHYLPSLAGAHARQVCNTFKDPGPLQYGIDSPLFKACRDRMDAAFDELPAPTPTLHVGGVFGSRTSSVKGSGSNISSMSMWNKSSNPCFAGCSMVTLGTDPTSQNDSALGSSKAIRIGRLRAGMFVQTPRGSRRVVAVLKTPVRQEHMCLIPSGSQQPDLIVTPWHPISTSSGAWSFPAHVARRAVRYTGSIYSVLLQRDADVDAHAICVNGVWGVTLGHGLTGNMEAGAAVGALSARKRRGQTARDVRGHAFFGDRKLVLRSLARLPRTRNGLMLGAGVRRNPATGLVDGFRRASVADGILVQGLRKTIYA